MKIACDVHVAEEVAIWLNTKGFNVACIAEHGVPDEEWFHEAIVHGCDTFISPDYDIKELCEKFHVNYIRLKPRHTRGQYQNRIYEKLKELELSSRSDAR